MLASIVPVVGALMMDGETVVNNFPITSAMLDDVTTYFNQAVSVAAPIGIGIMALILGIRFVPSLIKSLAR